MQILHRYTNACLWEGEASSMKEAVEKAVAEKANLRFANLRFANLRSANLPFKFPMCRMDFGGWSIWIREGGNLYRMSDPLERELAQVGTFGRSYF